MTPDGVIYLAWHCKELQSLRVRERGRERERERNRERERDR